MAEFKGFDDWVPIFQGGKQVDSDGKEHDGDALIDTILAKFDATEHEPPLVIGHPKINDPAFGWVSKLKESIKNGTKLLLMKAKDVVPEFAKAVEDGLWKKRSISLYPDGRLRHVGFLGAASPAVKGLANLKFDDTEDAVTFDFYDPELGTIARLFSSLREFIIEKFDMETADKVIPSWDVDYIKEEANKQTETPDGSSPAFSGAVTSVIDDRRRAANNEEEGHMSVFKEKVKNFLAFMGADMSKIPDDALPLEIPGGAQAAGFTEADLDAARTKTETETRKTVETEFAEKERKKRKEAREGEISTWCDAMVKEGKLTPALVKYGVPGMLSSLAASEDLIEFGEGDGKEKVTVFDRLKGLFETELPKLVDFKEIATREDAVSGDGTAGQQLTALITKKMADNDKLTYSAAFAEVQKENSDLAKEYLADIGHGSEE